MEREAPDGAPPRVPGHEVVGRIDALGEGVSGWRLGERVGVGFLAGEDRTCRSCRHGDVVNCENPVITGMTTDGGYAEIMLAEARGAVRVPDDLDAAEAAPLLCAGATTFNALRNAGARAGDVVAVHGLGGRPSRGAVREQDGVSYRRDRPRSEQGRAAAQLGAHRYIDARTEDVAAVLRALGGAKVVLGTAPTGSGMADTVAGLSARGKLIVVAVPGEPIAVNAVDLVFGGRSVVGALTGTVADNEETLAFARLQNVRPMIETFPLEQAQAAYDRMMRADVRFRAVLTMNSAHTGASA